MIQWSLTSCPPGEEPGETSDWRPALVPGTVAASGLAPREDLDWWYRGTFSAEPGGARLCFDGLATLAEVWLNGRSVLVSQNMFRSWTVDVVCERHNELRIVFRALSAVLAVRRSRPRWRTALVEHQNLRWIRTSLMGRIPGWTPPLPAIGPWRGVRVDAPLVDAIDLRTSLVDGVGLVRLRARNLGISWATLELGGVSYAVEVTDRLRADIELADAPCWWPHTHGVPHVLPARLHTSHGVVELGRVGFRTVTFDDGFEVNGRPVFTRGACWTPDPLTLECSPDTLRRVRDAGANLIRISGTMCWSSDLLLTTCDALGLLLWQDLPFANMDYPLEDAEFRTELEEEVASNLARLRRHPCVAMICGGSEIEQQAAMMGLRDEERRMPFFTHDLRTICAGEIPGVPYVTSTPTGGPLPFHTSNGITHYYGVGAYRRAISDVRQAAVRFTAECLGFSNVPASASRPPHHPEWKLGVPRDNGAGWDFEDVRDHYLREMFALDAVTLRSVDPERYLALSRVVSGELMLRTFAEWRRPGSVCGGALVWFLRDLRPGAGWGIFDDVGGPKVALRYLARAWARRAVLMTDEGLDGVDVHVHNEAPTPLTGSVSIELWSGRTRTGVARTELEVAPYASVTLSADSVFGVFHDLALAYRFGPPKHECVVSHLRCGDEIIFTDVLFPGGYTVKSHDVSVLAVGVAVGAHAELTLSSIAFLQAVRVEADGWEADDDAFHLVPGAPRTVRLVRSAPGTKPFKAHISAINLDGVLTVRG